MIEIGDRAGDAVLFDSSGHSRSLAELTSRRTLLIFHRHLM